MLTLKIEQDDDAFNPLKEFDQFGTFVCFHRDYDLSSPKQPFDTPEKLREFLKNEDPLWLPIYLYDHSGITIRTTAFSCPWDSGQVGVIYATKEKVRKEYGVKRISPQTRKKALDLLRAEVETFDQYLTGDVWGYTITDDETDEVLDSCWGFYGYDYAKEQAEEALEYQRKIYETGNLFDNEKELTSK